MDFMDIAKGAEKAVPKLADVAKDSMDWVKKSEKQQKKHSALIDNARSLHKDLEAEANNYFNAEPTAQDKHLDNFIDVKEVYVDDIYNLNSVLKPPKSIKDYIDYEIEDMSMAGTPDAVVHWNNPLDILNDYSKVVSHLHPTDKKQFDFIYENFETNKILPNKIDAAKTIFTDVKKMDKVHQENFLALLPGWTGTLDELYVTARML